MSRLLNRAVVIPVGPVPVSIGAGGLAPAGVFAALFVEIAWRTGLSVPTAAIVGALGGTASLVVHELGHAVAARGLRGVRPLDVSLIWLGAATRLEGAYVRGVDQARVALAGPLASFLAALTLVPLFTLPLSRETRYLIGALVTLNALLGLLNLIPVTPLDGYRALVGLLWCGLGSEGSARRTLRGLGIVWLPFELVGTCVLMWRDPFLGTLVLVTAAALLVQKLYARRVPV